MLADKINSIGAKHYAIIIAVMAAVFLALLVYEKIDRREFEKFLISDSEQFRDRIAERALVGPQEAWLKYTDFYNKVIGWYGHRYHKSKIQAMSPKQRADWVVNCYEYSEALNLPKFALVSLALMESDFNPVAVGPFDERGMFQMRHAAIAQAQFFYTRWLDPELKKKFRFEADDWYDLENPLNQLKIAALIIWGYKRMFRGDPRWYITAYHWGSDLIMKYYRNDILPPAKFVFNKGTIREDVRSPWSYYFVWAQINNAFSHFRKDINMPIDYLKLYRKQASALELQFIDSWKYVKTLRDTVDRIKAREKEFDEDIEREMKKLKRLTVKAEEEYTKLHKLIQTGNFRNISDVFTAGKAVYKKLIGDMCSEAMGRREKLVIYAAGGLILLLLFFSPVGIYCVLRRIPKIIMFRRKRDFIE